MAPVETPSVAEPRGEKRHRRTRLFGRATGGARKRVGGVDDDAFENVDPNLTGYTLLGNGARKLGPRGLDSDGYPAASDE